MAQTIQRPSLLRDERGAYLIEFTLVLPTFLLFIMGTFDIGMQMYAKAALAGAVEQAARASTLESNNSNQTAIDNVVRAQVGRVARYGTLSFTRQNYQDFSSVGQPERFTDTNGNGVRNAGECFTDSSGNGAWDADSGGSGQGGASDVVVYKANLSFDRLFPLWKMLGEPQRKTITITTVLRNQPFSSQASEAVICT